MYEKKPATGPELNVTQEIVFEEAVCSHEFSEGCKEPEDV
jgi:hypothetical protein